MTPTVLVHVVREVPTYGARTLEEEIYRAMTTAPVMKTKREFGLGYFDGNQKFFTKSVF